MASSSTSVPIPEITSTGTRAPFSIYYDKPFDKINSTTYTFSYLPDFTLVTPLTTRQPLFTENPPILVGVSSRPFFMLFYRKPVILSAVGSDRPVSIPPEDFPVGKVDAAPTSQFSEIVTVERRQGIQNKEIEDMNIEGGAYPTVYGATKTRTIQTTLTAEPGDIAYIVFPTPSLSEPVQYTTLPLPTDALSKQFPNGQPILFLTQVEGVVLDSNSQILTIATVVQAPPPPYVSDPAGGKVALANPSWKWASWSPAQRSGVVLASVIAFLVTGALLIYLGIVRQRRRKIDIESKERERKTGRAGLLTKIGQWLGILPLPGNTFKEIASNIGVHGSTRDDIENRGQAQRAPSVAENGKG